MPSPPEQDGALDSWIEGEIAEVRESGGVLKLVPLRVFGEWPIDGRRSSDSLLSPGPDIGVWVELRYAKGWVYFDDPDGGPHERVSLREGRDRFEVGQMIEIGRSKEFHGGFDRAGLQGNTYRGSTTANRMTFRGWILLRVGDHRPGGAPPG